MYKILINLFSKELSEESFEKFSSEYLLEYEIYNFQFSIEEMFPDIIEAIVKQISEENKYELAETKIVFQTNVVDLGHFTSKVYSEVIDAVVLVGDKVESLTEAVKELTFMNKIIQQKYSNYRIPKVFICESVERNIDYWIFLSKNKLFNDIAPISEFQLNEEQKLLHNYCYEISGGEYSTSIKCLTDKTIKIICNETDNPYNISEVTEPFGILKMLNLLLEYEIITSQQKWDLINIACSNIKQVNRENEFINIILRYLDSAPQKLENYINYTYICMALGYEEGLRRIYKYIDEKVDSLDMINVFAFITNSLVYESKLNQNLDAEIVQIRLKIMTKLKKHYSKKIVLPKMKNREANQIVIVVGQLLNLNHSPTKWAIDYANALKKYNPKIKVKIFVEDYFKYSPGELTWLYRFESKVSKSFASLHQEALANGIDVYYSDSNLKREDRLNKDIKAIVNFKPSVIYKMGSKYNLATDLLYDYYPVISHTMGGAEDSDFVDIFTGGYSEADMQKLYIDLNITNQSYVSHNIGIETPKKNILKSRIEYNLKESDFVLITVGNRLNEEINPDFVSEIERVIELSESYKWLIVGASDNQFINNRKLISNQIIFVPYEQNLFDLYHMCDVYVNPIRKAGGNSAAIAMKAKLPIITANEESDVGAFAGKDSCISLNQFGDEIEKLKNDKEYYITKSEEMYNRIESEFSFKKTVHDLEEIFERAIEKFEIRKSVLN